MTDQKPTGVFVRLPLSDEQRAKIVAEMIPPPISVSDAFEKVALNIGTPVTGGDLEVAAYDNIASGHLSRVRPCGANIELVRQSDAQAKIAALEAEVARLRETMEEIELGIDALSSEEDDGGRMTSSEMKRQALEVIRSEVKALKGGAA